MIGHSELYTYFKFVYLYQNENVHFLRVVSSNWGATSEYLQFPGRTLDSPLDKPQYHSHHPSHVACLLCICKCFSKYIEPMYADRMHCLLQILALCFIKDNLVRIKENHLGSRM